MAEVVTRHPDSARTAGRAARTASDLGYRYDTYLVRNTPTGFEIVGGPFSLSNASEAEVDAVFAQAKALGAVVTDYEALGSLVGLADPQGLLRTSARTGSRHVAFGEAPPTPGVPEVDKTLRCCPFCGSGDITGNSDQTISCGFCTNRFQIILESPHPFMPSALDGVPGPEIVGPDGTSPLEGGNGMPPMSMDPNADPGDPGAPGADDGGLEGFRTDQPAQPGATLEQFRVDDAPAVPAPKTPPKKSARQYPVTQPGDEPCSECGGTGWLPEFGGDEGSADPDHHVPCSWCVNGVAPKKSARQYLTGDGVLTEAAYRRHLALRFADDRDAVLPQIRAEHKGAK